jgi:hypothetical protein
MHAWRGKVRKKKTIRVTCNCPHDPTEHRNGVCLFEYSKGVFCPCPIGRAS